jgi:hypothetical protein
LTTTLPSAVGRAGRIYIIKRINLVGNVTVAAQVGEAIDGAATQILVPQYASISVISNGANWFVF